MIRLENAEIVGWEHAIRGMRNPKNSWDRSDSSVCLPSNIDYKCTKCEKPAVTRYCIGNNDHDLMMRLVAGGPVHAKYRRMIVVYVDITAPQYWWSEYDTYKVGTVANSCSKMHKLTDNPITDDDFSIDDDCLFYITDTIIECERLRQLYIDTKDKKYWRALIQLLPESYNQKRTVMLNYEVLANMYHSRKDHKLIEWRDFCKWIESLPYSEIITGEVKENE